MEWHIFKCVQNKGTSGKFLIDCKLKNFILELNIIQNTVAWSAEVCKIAFRYVPFVIQCFISDSTRLYRKLSKRIENGTHKLFEDIKRTFKFR